VCRVSGFFSGALAFCAFTLKFPIQIALALAGFACQAFEGVFFGEAFGFELLQADGQAGGLWCCGASDSFDKQGDFASDSIPGSQSVFHFENGSSEKLFVEFGEFAGDDDSQFRSPDGFEIGEGFENAVRCFVEDQGSWRCAFVCAGRLGEGFEASPASAGFFGQEAEELELSGRKAGGYEGADGGVGSGDGIDRDACGDGGLGEPSAGVADTGHAGVRDYGDALTGLEGGDQFNRALALVVLMQAYGGGGDFEVVEQLLGLACVFAGDAVGRAQDAQGAEGDVLKVADRRADEIETGGEFEFGIRIETGHRTQDIALYCVPRARFSIDSQA
jgi:hypothetical protein